MARVRSKNTTPERVVRKLAHGLGYRFRLHRSDLPGKPDIVFPKLRKIVFVHGCFWHRHPGCPKSSVPKTSVDFWTSKFERNQERDRKNHVELLSLGWDSCVIWECETKQPECVVGRLVDFLNGR
jgi:DNA mismatch endonuclease (patch repair protein)